MARPFTGTPPPLLMARPLREEFFAAPLKVTWSFILITALISFYVLHSFSVTICCSYKKKTDKKRVDLFVMLIFLFFRKIDNVYDETLKFTEDPMEKYKKMDKERYFGLYFPIFWGRQIENNFFLLLLFHK